MKGMELPDILYMQIEVEVGSELEVDRYEM